MRLTCILAWRPQTEAPPSADCVSAVMAYPDPDTGWVLADELHLWDGTAWAGERSGRAPGADWWWAPEPDLVAPLNAALPTGPEAA